MTRIRALRPIEGEDYGQGETPVAVMLDTDEETDVSNAYAHHLIVALEYAEEIVSP
jgi:hypothetical protein